MFYIYRITNNLGGKVYIGQTNSPALRWSQHKYTARTEAAPSQLITRAIKKYGEAAFMFDVIATSKTQDDCNELEQILIAQYDALNLEIGYNLDPGGKNGPRSAQTGLKISQALQARYENHDGPRKGQVFSEETKKKMSLAAMGKPGTNNGRKFSEEWKNRISGSLTGKKASDETRQKLSESHKGQVASNRKLTFEIAEQIRNEYKSDGISQKALGIKYKVSQDSIFNIVHNKTYVNKDK